MTNPPADPSAGDEPPREGSSHALEEAARVRRSVAETIARVRKLTAGIGASSEKGEADDPAPDDSAPPPPEPPTEAAAAPPSAEERKGGADDGGALSGDVAALVERTRNVIARTRHLLDKSRRESAERKGE